MTTTIASTPRADGFRMPAEFEPHSQTWMLWPQRPDNWRFGAKPAQRAWVAWPRPSPSSSPSPWASTTTSTRTPASSCRPRCASWSCRPTTPGCATAARPSWWTTTAACAWSIGTSTPGAASGRPVLPLGQGPAHPAQDRRAGARGPLQGAAGHGGRLVPRGRPGHGAHHRRVPAERRPQPRAVARADRAAPVRLPRRREGAVARPRHRPGRDQRPRGRRGLLRAPRRGAGGGHRRHAGLALRAAAGQPAAPAACHRRARPAPRGAHHAHARHHGDHRRRGLGRGSGRGQHPAATPATRRRPRT